MADGKILVITESALVTDATEQSVARLVGAMAPWGEISLLGMGQGEQPAGDLLSIPWAGVTEWLEMAPQGIGEAEPWMRWSREALVDHIVSLAGRFTHIVAAASEEATTVLALVAARLQRGMVTGVQKICAADTFVRAILAGNALATIQVQGQPVCLTLHPAAFAAATRLVREVPRVRLSAPPGRHLSLPRLLLPAHASRRQSEAGRRPDLACARVVVAGGGGLERAGSFALIEALADALGGAVGASRGAVDAELAPNTWQIGQTGHIIAPEIYIGIGISGAIQHLAGIKGAKTLIAINHDPAAPLMQVADIAWQADLYEAVPSLIEALRSKTIP
ncbi:MAG: electron transfer flavoprotein subunit alpha/FixB family protein [Magnetococcales bacterium]|nr:electron transfer flavoprotein subunit alpha/FixB family protein [Magnetococcales bacterium]